MDKKKIINISLISFSVFLVVLSIVLFAISLYSLFMFFIANINQLQKINFENINEISISLSNPSMLNIEYLSINSEFQLLNKTYTLISLYNLSIPSNSFKTVTFERINFSQLQEDLNDFLFRLLLEGKNESEIKKILEEELSKSKIFGNIEINLQNFLRVSLYVENNLSRILKLS